MVTVETYAESENSTPNYATLLIKDAGVTKLTSKTVFNILKDTDLRLSSILKTDQISIEESQNGKWEEKMVVQRLCYASQYNMFV